MQGSQGHKTDWCCCCCLSAFFVATLGFIGYSKINWSNQWSNQWSNGTFFMLIRALFLPTKILFEVHLFFVCCNSIYTRTDQLLNLLSSLSYQYWVTVSRHRLLRYKAMMPFSDFGWQFSPLVNYRYAFIHVTKLLTGSDRCLSWWKLMRKFWGSCIALQIVTHNL